MSKKYKQDYKDHYDEHEAMSHKKRGRMNEGSEMHGHKESWGRGEHSNMPKDLIMKDYPKAHDPREKDLGDTMSSIDREIDQMEGQRGKRISNQH